MLTRVIPSSGENIPVLGMGTWKTFDVSETSSSFRLLPEVLETMHACGGTLIDSSPMYGKAETTIGLLTGQLTWREDLFYATKVWTSGKHEGIRQMKESFEKMKRSRMDLMQIHNLVDWETQLATLKDWKAEGKIRYIGITHYTDSMHEELERVFSSESIDFVQFNYSIFSRHAEQRLLQATADHGVATLINRPLGEGKGLLQLQQRSLPSWAATYGIENWSQFVLLYLVLHPAVTVVIPATGNPAHARQNYHLPVALPDFSLRKEMLQFINS